MGADKMLPTTQESNYYNGIEKLTATTTVHV